MIVSYLCDDCNQLADSPLAGVLQVLPHERFNVVFIFDFVLLEIILQSWLGGAWRESVDSNTFNLFANHVQLCIKLQGDVTHAQELVDRANFELIFLELNRLRIKVITLRS